MEGIVIGTVTANWEKDHPGMIQVQYLLGPAEMTEWIPVMTPFGGDSYGSYHLPEVGNTVIIAFEAGNANRPVVLGSLWSGANPLPAETASQNNSKLLWQSKSGYSLTVEEEEKQISWSDPDGTNTLVWSTEEKTLTLDVAETVILKFGGNEFMKLQKGSVTVTGPLAVTAESTEIKTEKTCAIKADTDMSVDAKNIVLTPQQKFSAAGKQAEIKPSQGILLKAAKLEGECTQLSLKGQQTSVEGTTLELKAKASGKLTASGILEVKGSMLKLN